jgi:hypothetical protein
MGLTATADPGDGFGKRLVAVGVQVGVRFIEDNEEGVSVEREGDALALAPSARL